MTNVIDLRVEHKTYNKRRPAVTVLDGFSLSVAQGEKVAIAGESGVGKSSLLNILGLIDQRYSGSYTILGRNAREMSDRESSAWRNERIGFVLQESALIHSLSIADNIKLPMLYARSIDRRGQQGRFEEIVDTLDIGSILHKKPLECSGGEKGRAAFARGVMMAPPLILADEPTASLDLENRSRMMHLLFGLNRDHGSTIVTVTHDIDVAHQHDRVITLERKA